MMPASPAGGLYNLQQLTEALPDTYPLTGVCVVADKAKCPAGYTVIERSYYKDEDADLWKDSFFGRRVTRYLCYTRHPSQGHMTHVVGDIALLNDKDDIPPGFTLIDSTTDTREKAMKKRILCVKMVPLNQTHDAIVDLVVTNRNRKQPPGFSIVGPASHMLVCYKYGAIPLELLQASTLQPSPQAFHLTQEMLRSRSATSPASPVTSNGLPYPLHPNDPASPQRSAPPPPIPPRPHRADSETHLPASGTSSPWSASQHQPPFLSTLGRRQSTMRGKEYMPQDDPYLALRGMPFEVNPKLTELTRLKNFILPELSYTTDTEVFEKYSYDFTKERRCVGGGKEF